jgi:hypothetical protein
MIFLIKKILRNLNLTKKNYPNWKKLIKNYFIKKVSKNNKKILICTSAGGQLFDSHFDSLMGFALSQNGANVEFLLCDKILPACMLSTSKFIPEETFIKKGPANICRSCLDDGKLAFEGLDLKINFYSENLNKNEINEAKNLETKLSYSDLKFFKLDGVNIGEHALAGALRYYAVGDLEADNVKYAEIILRKFVRAGILTKFAITNLIKKNFYDIIVLNHGIYIPQGVIVEVAKKFDINIVTYTAGYREKSIVFSHDDTYHKTMMEEDVNLWENLIWSQKHEEKILEYLSSRKLGTQDWKYYFNSPSFNIKENLLEMGVNLDKPIIGMLTNIIWDAQLIYPNNIFKNMMDCVFQTIDFFIKRPDLQLVIRCHPGEMHSDRESKQKVNDQIQKRYEKLPKNIFIISSKSNLSTYSFADFCNTMIIYATKMGIEFAPLGLNIICAGESYIRNKGITNDPKNLNSYFDMLHNLPFKGKKSEAQLDRAKKYAYHYFFRRSIQIQSLNSLQGKWPPFYINQESVEKIISGKDLGMKLVCDSIINKKPFIYNDENHV